MKRIGTFDVLLLVATFAIVSTWYFLHLLGFRSATAFLTISDPVLLRIGVLYVFTWLAAVTVVPVVLIALTLKVALADRRTRELNR